MALIRLEIQQLRNITSASLKPAPGLNLIHGVNGSGKTSVLEAIWYLSVGRSFRTHLSARSIQHGKDALTLFAEVENGPRLGLRRDRNGDVEVRINGDRPPRLSDLAACLPVQLISPESFALLLEGPKPRREFIDWGAFHQDPQFIDVWTRYRRLLKQRNNLLKQRAPLNQFEVWDRQLAEYGVRLTESRKQWVNSLNDELAGIIDRFLPDVPIRVAFSQGWDVKLPLNQIFNEQVERDMELGYTVSGPHKADLRLRVGNLPVQDSLSRGQLKLLVCALRIAQGVLLTKTHQGQCIFLVDDLASELDAKHRQLLLDQLQASKSQVFVTAIDAEQLSTVSWQRQFHVEQGRITSMDS